MLKTNLSLIMRVRLQYPYNPNTPLQNKKQLEVLRQQRRKSKQAYKHEKECYKKYNDKQLMKNLKTRK